MHCTFCKNEIEVIDKVGRQDVCTHCQHDLHCCKQCRFYDQTAYNDCNEPQAERVIDKEKANFCEYFVFGPDAKVSSEKEDTMSKLEDLFKK